MANKKGNGKMHDYVPQDAKILWPSAGQSVIRAWREIVWAYNDRTGQGKTWAVMYHDATNVRGIRHIRVTVQKGTQQQCDALMAKLVAAVHTWSQCTDANTGIRGNFNPTIKHYTYNSLKYGPWLDGMAANWSPKPLPRKQQPNLLANNGIRVWYYSNSVSGDEAASNDR